MAAHKTIHAQVLTPEGAKFDGEVLGITVPGASGSFKMLYNHAPIVSALDIGKVEIQLADGSELIFAVSGGFVEMNDNSVTLLAERAIEPVNINVPQAELDLKEAKARLKDPSVTHDEVERQIRVAKNLITIAQG
jgi:F-type H+-transporting ATPase subunit epsilon